MAQGWERIATHEGGTVIALTVVPHPTGLRASLLAATAAGLFRSDDGGRHWTSTSDRPLPLLSAVASSTHFADNSILYAGTQTGFHRSTDGGVTWRQTLSEGHVLAVTVVPDADGDEDVFIGTSVDGILRSADRGLTWTGANPGLLDRTILALAFSPEAHRDQTGFAATPSSLYRTRNGGKSWREVELPLDEPAVQCLALSPRFASDRMVLAGTERDGLLRSDDAGATWELVRGAPGGSINAIAFSEHDTDPFRVAIATPDGVALSVDGGQTWRLTDDSGAPVFALSFVRDGTDEALVAGLYRAGIAHLPLSDPRYVWHPANSGLHATAPNTIVALPAFGRDGTLLVSGPEAGLRVSVDGGHTWGDAADLGDIAIHSLAVASDTVQRCIIFAATDAGVFRSRDRGETWEEPPSGSQQPTHLVAATATGGALAIFAVTPDNRVLASDDGGDTWRDLDTPFARDPIIALACVRTADGIPLVFVGTLSAAATSGMRAVTLWRSPDAGRTWAPWMDAAADGTTMPIAVVQQHGNARLDDMQLFIGLGNRVLRPRPNAWHTRGGARLPLWYGPSLTGSRGDPLRITALAVSPNYDGDGTVFAATSAGVYRSRDRGRTFAPWNEEIPPSPMIGITTASASTDAGEAGSVLVFALGVDGSIWRRTNAD